MLRKYIYPHIKKILPLKIIDLMVISRDVILNKHSTRELLLNKFYFYYFIYRHKIIYHYKVIPCTVVFVEINHEVIIQYLSVVLHSP